MPERILVGLIGHNILKSLSPALHEDAFAAAGRTGHYHLMDLDVLKGRRLNDMLQAVRTAGFAGFNVTHPYKEAVLPLLDEVSAEARQIGAVNTVVIDHAGRLLGHNTDRVGFHRAFDQALGASAAGQPVLLLGAGGAGRAVAFALMDLGAAPLLVHDKDPARATALCADLIMRFGADRCEVAMEPAVAAERASGIVNATPVGMLGVPGTPIRLALVRPRHWVADVIYTPLETELIAGARARGCAVMTGGGMCVQQAAEAFHLFTGLRPDIRRMQRTFDAACTRRDRALATV
jgi:shikimate dehydrogenase